MGLITMIGMMQSGEGKRELVHGSVEVVYIFVSWQHDSA